MTNSAQAPGTATSQPRATLSHATHLLLAAEACCLSLQLVQQAYNALERFFIETNESPEEIPISRAEFGALLALVNEAAMKRLDDTMAAVYHARGEGAPPPAW